MSSDIIESKQEKESTKPRMEVQEKVDNVAKHSTKTPSAQNQSPTEWTPLEHALLVETIKKY